MGKVVICLVLTLVFSFLSVQSFLSNDYARLQRWLAYYQEYKAFEEAVKRGNASKAELFERLKTMYPGQASELEAHLKEKYGDLTDTAKDTQSTLSDTLNDTLETFSSSRADVDAIKKEAESKLSSKAEKAEQAVSDPKRSSSRESSKDMESKRTADTKELRRSPSDTVKE